MFSHRLVADPRYVGSSKPRIGVPSILSFRDIDVGVHYACRRYLPTRRSTLGTSVVFSTMFLAHGLEKKTGEGAAYLRYRKSEGQSRTATFLLG